MAGSEQGDIFSVIRPTLAPSGGTALVPGTAVDGYGTAPTGEPFSTFAIQKPLQRPSKRKQTSVDQGIRPETRAALRTGWKAALDAAADMILAAGGADGMGLVIAADNLEVALDKLWGLRAVRDLDWRTILNHAQGMLRQAFAEKRVEQLTPEQCRSIQTIIDRYLGPATKSVDDLNEVVRIIEDSGFDPYYAISGDPDE